VDERRLELEHLERRIFPIGRALVHQDSASSLEGVPSATDDSTIKKTTQLEQAFERLKAVTGTERQLQAFKTKSGLEALDQHLLGISVYLLYPYSWVL
jgi:hypothetical protein